MTLHAKGLDTRMMFFPLFQTPSQDSLSLLDHYHFYLTRLSNLDALIVLDFGLKR
jgi:hypothetical protein